MNPTSKKITNVINNTIPKTFSGEFNRGWIYSLDCFDMEDGYKIFQVVITLKIIGAIAKNDLFLFRTQTNIRYKYPSSEDEAINLGLTFFETAREGFNGHLQDVPSNLTFNQTCLPPPTEQLKLNIRASFQKCHIYQPIIQN